MTNHITLSDFPASCSCMKLTSKQGRPYWFRTCDLNTSIWDAGAHAVSFPADYAITAANGTLRTRYALLGMSYCTVDSWLLDGVNWYYMSPENGRMVKNAYIEGRYLDGSGIWHN